MKNITIRKATVSNSEFAYQTKKAAFREYVEKVWGWDENEQRQLHERRFASQDFWIVRWSGVDVGILAIVRQPDCLKVNQLFIFPAYQNRGIGAACMKRIIGGIAVPELPIRLQVLKVNSRAFAFFQRFGFRRVGKSDTHILMEKPPLG